MKITIVFMLAIVLLVVGCCQGPTEPRTKYGRVASIELIDGGFWQTDRTKIILMDSTIVYLTGFRTGYMRGDSICLTIHSEYHITGEVIK